MNHKQRRKVRKTLLACRKRMNRTPEDLAGVLGWSVAFYLEAEAGKAGLSLGQKADLRALIDREMESATVRDRLRAPSRAKRIPLIGGTRLVPAGRWTGKMDAPWIDTQNLPRDPEGE